MKIALVGTASNWKETPFQDPSWQVWAISGLWPEIPRIDRLYDIHKRIVTEEKPGFIEFANSLEENWVIQGKNPKYPKARAYPVDLYIQKHGREPFASSCAWMLAEAIAQEPEVIGLWGFNMTAESEYGHQKPGVRQLIGYAQAKGIEIVTPPGSELMLLPWMYGFEEKPAVLEAITKRKLVMKERLAAQQEAARVIQRDIDKYEGAIAAFEMMENNYYKAKQ